MPSDKPVSDPDGWARLRFAIIGPLLADPPPPGELGARLKQLATKDWRHPVTGLPLRFGFATLERWYYLARDARDPVAALRRRRRRDAGEQRGLTPQLMEAVRAQHREHPGWTVQLHYDNLAALVAEQTSPGPLPSYATVRRFMKRTGLHRRRVNPRRTPGAEQAARRLEACEVRSYEAEHVHALWLMPCPGLCGVKDSDTAKIKNFSRPYSAESESGGLQQRDEGIGYAKVAALKLERNHVLNGVELLRRVDAQVHLRVLYIGMAEPQSHLAHIACRLQHHQSAAVSPMS
jgi:hypothetical protein